MEKEAIIPRLDLVDRTVDVIIAYLSNNSIPSSELAPLISAVHSAFEAAANSQVEQASPDRPAQAEIRKSVRPEGIKSFIDGRTYKTLKRHLAKHDLDAESYRRRYGLPQDYPMVARSYSERRSEISLKLGLGRRSEKPESTNEN